MFNYILLCLLFFFFRQKSAYDMRISDWSSDVCSSDLNQAAIAIQNARLFSAEQHQRQREAAILDLMRVAASSLDLEVVIENILRHLIRLIPAKDRKSVV